MKERIKLRDLTVEQYEKYRENRCDDHCDGCIFKNMYCMGLNELCWIHHKDLYSDKFLDQEVEIEMPDILTKEDEEYLETVIKPFKDNIRYIIKCNSIFNKWENVHVACDSKTPDSHVSFKKGTMFKYMELGKKYTLEELGLFKEQKPKRTSTPTKKKITLTDFWNSKEKLAIHCNTETKANRLLKAFDKLGKKWRGGDSYLKKNHWNVYAKETCYDNSNRLNSYNYYKQFDYIIYEFDDVDLEK